MATVVLVGTLDTKGGEYAWLHDRLLALDCEAVLVDAGIGEARAPADVGTTGSRRPGPRRGRCAKPATGERPSRRWGRAGRRIAELYAQGRLDGVLAVGGSGGSSIAARAVRDLPIGLPKLIVSTMASGDVSPYVAPRTSR